VGQTASSHPSAVTAPLRRQGPALRAARFADYEQIARLQSRYGLHIDTYEEWSHLWLANPTYREVQSAWSIGWVLEDEAGRIVGCVENIPLAYELGGTKVLAATGRAWAADPEYRSAALLLLDRVINQPAVDLYLNNTFTENSAPAVSVFECTRVPVGAWDRSAFWITNRRRFAEAFLAFKRYRLAKLLSYPVSATAWLVELARQGRARAGDVEVEGCPAFDERFDGFWEALRDRRPNMLLAVRTREMLAWHYRPLLSSRRLWIATVVNGPRLAAYAVFDRWDRLRIGLKRVRLVDFQSLDGTTDLLWPLLSWAIRRCKAEGIHMLESVGRWLGTGEPLDEIAPYQRTLPVWTFVYRANDPELSGRLRDPHAWDPSLYDGDASLVR
jgi:hypothetical protein